MYNRPDYKENPNLREQDPFNLTTAKDPNLKNYIKTLVASWRTQEDLLQRGYDGTYHGTAGVEYNVLKKGDIGMVVGLDPAQ